jgi:hypothetical protein
MSSEQSNDGEVPQAPTAESLGGVLAALPRARPQRASARRTAARERAQSETAAPKPARAGADAAGDARKKAKPAKRKAPKRGAAQQSDTRRKAIPKPTPPRPSSRSRGQERAPKQGYEPEEEIEIGATVHPPSGGELIESIVDIFGELASAGTSAGGRLLKDALSVFRRP